MNKFILVLMLVCVSFNVNAFTVSTHHDAPVMDSDHPSSTDVVQSNPVYYTPHGTFNTQSSVVSTPQHQIDGWHDTDWIFYMIILSIIIGALIAWITLKDD